MAEIKLENIDLLQWIALAKPNNRIYDYFIRKRCYKSKYNRNHNILIAVFRKMEHFDDDDDGGDDDDGHRQHQSFIIVYTIVIVIIISAIVKYIIFIITIISNIFIVNIIIINNIIIFVWYQSLLISYYQYMYCHFLYLCYYHYHYYHYHFNYFDFVGKMLYCKTYMTWASGHSLSSVTPLCVQYNIHTNKKENTKAQRCCQLWVSPPWIPFIKCHQYRICVHVMPISCNWS